MKVTINGKELNDLEKREQQYFETVKTAGYMFVGGVCLFCGALLYDAIASLLDNFGAGSIGAAIAALLQK